MKNKIELKKGMIILYAIIGMLFSFFAKTEADLFRNGNIEWNARFISLLLVVMLSNGGLFCLLYVSVKAIYLRIKEKRGNETVIRGMITPGKTFLYSFIINIISFFPFFLSFYPAICAYDVPVQLNQIVEHAYNEHHPLAHTLLMELCLKVGTAIFKTGNAGMAICALIQLTLLALSFAYVLYTLCKCNVRLHAQIIVQAWFSLTLINGYMAVSITKDTIFTAGVVILISSLILRLNGHEEKANLLIEAVAGVIVCLFRNNGIYAFIIMIAANVIALLVSRDHKHIWVKTLLTSFLSVIIGIAFLKVLSVSLDATQGDKREMLSVPIQQLARVMVYEEGNLDEEDIALINEFILNEAYRDYNPVISDPVKKNTNTSVVRYQTGRFANTYFKLLKKYPGHFVNAFLALVAGYTSPFDETYRIMKVDGSLVTRNYIQHSWTAHEFDEIIHEAPKLPGLKRVLDKFAEEDRFINPVLILFYVPGIYLWLYLIIMAIVLERRSYEKIVPLVFVFGFYLTLFLGPTMHLRYLYPLICVLPVFIAGKKNET